MMICIYCENTYEIGTIVCPVCNEYKGMMTTEAASKEYDFLEYLND